MKKAMPGVFRLAGFNFGLMYIGKNKKNQDKFFCFDQNECYLSLLVIH